VNARLSNGELVAAGQAFADVRDWAGSAWRSLSSGVPPATRASVLASVDEMAARLEEIRLLLAGTELPATAGLAPRTGVRGGQRHR
jgi:hypothetical protein